MESEKQGRGGSPSAHQVDKLLRLNTFMRDVSTSLSFGSVVRTGLDEFLEILNADAAFLFMDEGDTLTCRGFRPSRPASDLKDFMEHRINECLCGAACATGTPVYSRNIFRDSRCTRDECKELGLTSLCAVPLYSGAESIGLICIGFSKETTLEDQSDFIESLARFFSLTLNNALNYEAARRSEASFRSIVEASPFGIHQYTLEPGGRLVFTGSNPAADRILGTDHTEFLGRTIEEAFPGLVSTDVPDRYRAAAAEGKSWETERIVYDEGRISGAYSVIAYQTAPGKMVAQFYDTTEQKQLLEAARRNQKLEALGVLAGGIAHDFNNLLGGIFGYMELAACSPDVPDTIRTYLDEGAAVMERTRALTSQLLTFAKGGEPVRECQPLFPVIEKTVCFALSGSSVSCSFSPEAHLPACCFDGNQIAQVVQNIVINAVQAMPDGGQIEVSARKVAEGSKEFPHLRTGPYVAVAFRDTGTGIPESVLPNIFDPFFTTKSEGHGLGLAICHSIAVRHGGTIEAQSKPGKGSTFTLLLPASNGINVSPKKKDTVSHSGSGRFLVMDDEGFLRDVLARMLETLGYTAVRTADGSEALETFRAAKAAGDPFAGVILDLTVPGGMGGRETVADIRKMDPAVPVFVSSGYASEPVMAAPQEHGFTASLVKPFNLQDLKTVLDEHAGRRDIG